MLRIAAIACLVMAIFDRQNAPFWIIAAGLWEIADGIHSIVGAIRGLRRSTGDVIHRSCWNIKESIDNLRMTIAKKARES